MAHTAHAKTTMVLIGFADQIQVNRKSILVFLLKIRSVHSLHIAPLVVKDQAALRNVIGVLKNVLFISCTLFKFHVFLTSQQLHARRLPLLPANQKSVYTNPNRSSVKKTIRACLRESFLVQRRDRGKRTVSRGRD